jgi:hypothetical protein
MMSCLKWHHWCEVLSPLVVNIEILMLIIRCPLITKGISLFEEVARWNVVEMIKVMMALERSVDIFLSLILIRVRIA